MLYIRREEQGNRKNAAKFIRDEARGKEKIQTTGRRKGSPFIFKNIETKKQEITIQNNSFTFIGEHRLKKGKRLFHSLIFRSSQIKLSSC